MAKQKEMRQRSLRRRAFGARQAATAERNMGIPRPSKRGRRRPGTSTQNGADMDNVDRGKDWPEIEELDSLGFTKG